MRSLLIRARFPANCTAGGLDDPPRGPLELWVADTVTGEARKLLGGLNTVFDECASFSCTCEECEEAGECC